MYAQETRRTSCESLKIKMSLYSCSISTVLIQFIETGFSLIYFPLKKNTNLGRSIPESFANIAMSVKGLVLTQISVKALLH